MRCLAMGAAARAIDVASLNCSYAGGDTISCLPTRAEPSRAELSRAEPSRSELSRADPR